MDSAFYKLCLASTFVIPCVHLLKTQNPTDEF